MELLPTQGGYSGVKTLASWTIAWHWKRVVLSWDLLPASEGFAGYSVITI